MEEGAPAVAPRRRQRFLSVADAAEILQMSDVNIYRAIQAGEFPAVKVRGRYVVPARAIDAMEDAAVNGQTVVDAATWAERSAA